MSYVATDNEEIVKKITETTIDLSVYIERYKDLKEEYQNLPELKTVADQETLDFYNVEKDLEKTVLLHQLQGRAQILYKDLLPIFNAGLIPDKFLDEFQQLENFVNG